VKRALITGVAGQDGSYLAECLLEKGYQVFGLTRPVREDAPDTHLHNIAHLLDRISLRYTELGLDGAARDSIAEAMPDECYHLAASSFVSFAFEDEAATIENNIRSTHELLGALREKAPACRLFFAGTSEMFGAAERAPQDEETPFRPRSIYGISKTAGHHLVRYYRDTHGLFACTGILFNHESPRRGPQFVTRKITMGAARIKLGLDRKLFLGNLDALRDWGWAPDYVRAMWLMLQQDEPADLVIATGEIRSVREFVDAAFARLGLDWRDHVEVDRRFYREAEKVPLCGNCRRAGDRLGWRPSMDFAAMVGEMVDSDLALLGGGQTAPGGP